MTGHARMILFAMPLAAVLTVAGTVAVLKKPWGVLKLVDTVGASTESLAGAMASFAPGHAHVAASFAGETSPVTAIRTPPAVAAEQANAASVTAGRGREAGDDGQVDYNRLNRDMGVVADTLESFNQKLLRMIAQARATQQQEAEASRRRETPEVETPPAPQPPHEEETLTQ